MSKDKLHAEFLARSATSSYVVNAKRKRKLIVDPILHDVMAYVGDAEARIKSATTKLYNAQKIVDEGTLRCTKLYHKLQRLDVNEVDHVVGRYSYALDTLSEISSVLNAVETVIGNPHNLNVDNGTTIIDNMNNAYANMECKIDSNKLQIDSALDDIRSSNLETPQGDATILTNLT